jgi:F-type H+-transporting ATPase subunit alpha
MTIAPEGLHEAIDEMFAGLNEARRSFTPKLRQREVGAVTNVSTGIAKISGLPGVGFEELVKFPEDVLGIAFNVDEDEVGVVLLGDYERLQAGDEVERTGRVMDVAVGEGLLGRVIDPLGRPLDEGGPVIASGRLPIERLAAPIMDRAPVTEPLQTGIKVIDALIPIGRGQRELILGDRQTGKTAIALDTILNQRSENVVCIYCAIGQRASSVAKAVAVLREKGAMDNTVVVVTKGNDPPGLAYIAPYAATSIAEHFMEAGRDVLIVYDDLTQHAQAYRELSLLLRRPPGREAFPGDIFYIHSRLLERATRLRAELGGGSLTALPIVETEAQNISAYIPTNLISITDGQIYLSPSLFELGVLPAVDVGKSVSRVGGKAQRAVYREAAGDLKLAYAQFEELETFARFGARLDDATRNVIDHGQRIRAILKQSEFSPVPVPGQVAVLLALTTGLFDAVPLEQMAKAELALQEAATKMPAEISSRFSAANGLSAPDRESILEFAKEALAQYQSVSKAAAKAQAPDLGKSEPKPENAPPIGASPPIASMHAADRATKKGGSSAWGLWLAVLLLTCLAGWFALRHSEQKPKSSSARPPGLNVTGVVSAAMATPIEARASGVISAVYCTDDMQVKAGHLCAKIDPALYQAAVERNERELTAAVHQLEKDNTDYAHAKANFERVEALTKRRSNLRTQMDAAARQTLKLAEKRKEVAEQALKQTQAALKAAQAELAKTDIVAPTDGIVIASNMHVGEIVVANAETPLFSLAPNLAVMRINVAVGEKRIAGIKPGDKASFTIEALPDRSFIGEVTQIITSQKEGGSYNVVIDAPDSNLSIKPGMIANIHFAISQGMDAPDKENK